MPFDIRTLLVSVALATAFCAGARLLLWRMHPTIPGLGRWALAAGAAVVTLALVFSYGKFHWQSFLSLAQLFAVIGLILSWDGFRRFIGKSPLTPFVLSVIATIVLTWIVITQTQYSEEVKAVGNAFLMAILSLLIARDLLISPKLNTPAIRATGWVYVVNAAIFLIRGIAAHETPEIVDPLNPNGVTAFILLWLLCFMIAITLGMVLMTAERLQEDLDIQANRDPLTGALNRRSFSLLNEKAVAHSIRHKQPLSVLIIDLDKFKHVNDRLGHDVGDVILCRFVSVAEEILREEDIFCRFGGEEFVALLPNTSSEKALVVANRLRNSFTIDSTLLDSKENNEPFEITASIGIAELEKGEVFENFLRRADTALYKAKDNGRNCCEVSENKGEQKAVLSKVIES